MKTLYPKLKCRRYTTYLQKIKLNSFLFRDRSPGIFRFCIFIAVLALLNVFFAGVCLAQTGIRNFTSQNSAALSGNTYTGPGGGLAAQSEYIPSSNNTFTYNFGSASGLVNGLRPVNGYTTANSAFTVISNIVTSVVMRRVNNSVVSGNRDILSFAGSRTPDINTGGQTSSALTLNINAEYVADMGTAFSQNNLLIGTDNIFSNQGNGNGNNNNIERVDVLIAGGFLVPNVSKYGFPILERGTYAVHDAFKVAVITAIDASGNPSAYSKVVSANASSYNNTNAANPVADGIYTYFLFKRDGTNDPQVDQHITGQGIGGVSFRFSDFGIADSTTIYGYSIMANDFSSASGNDAVDYTNTTYFPTNTSETTGGLDPLAVMGLAYETNILPVQLSSFIASEKAGKSELEWTTVTEMNNSGFRVERSANGRDWAAIGFVSSKASEGNSSQILEYSYYDNNPLKGINYYRLKQYDLSNHENISEIRVVSIGSNDPRVIKAFPNPVSSNIIYVQGVERGTNLRLTDMRGTVVSQATATHSIEGIPVDKLDPGIYFLQVVSNNALVKTIKVVKM
jgi:Secretion system C-terminal sorting domain